jgi:ABC-type Fe3+/spermidine/putrescine transport system ATPase subunit
VVQAGDPLEVYLQPRNRFAAEFTGSTNLLECRPVGGVVQAGMTQVDVGFGSPVRAWANESMSGTLALLSIRPEAVELLPGDTDTAGPDVFTGQVVRRTLLGNVTEYVVQIGSARLRVSAGTSDVPDLDTQVTLRLTAERCMLLPHTDAPAADASHPDGPACDAPVTVLTGVTEKS